MQNSGRVIRVLTMGNISSAALEKLTLANGGLKFLVGSDVKEPDVIIVRSAKCDVDKYPTLKLVVRAGSGTDNISGSRMESGKVCVQATPSANSEGVAEYVLMAMLALTRNVPAATEYTRTLEEKLAAKLERRPTKDEFKTSLENDKKHFLGRELSEQTLGVIGTGQIGFRVVRIARSLGMKVIVYEKDPLSKIVKMLPPRVRTAKSMTELLQEADIVTVHVPGDNNTHLFGEAQIAQMRHGAILINSSRLTICDSGAVLKAIEEGKLRGYAVDFLEPGFAPHPRILCTPHIAGNTAESQEKCGIMAAEQVIDFYHLGNVSTSKNWPSNMVEQTESACMRLGILHHNVVGALDGIEKVIKDAGVNIGNTGNKTNKKFGYYLVDLDQRLAEEHVDAIRALSSTIEVMIFPLQ